MAWVFFGAKTDHGFYLKILGLNIGNFWTGFGQCMLRVGFDPETDVFGFCCMFW